MLVHYDIYIVLQMETLLIHRINWVRPTFWLPKPTQLRVAGHTEQFLKNPAEGRSAQPQQPVHTESSIQCISSTIIKSLHKR